MPCLTVRAVGLLTEALSYEVSKTAIKKSKYHATANPRGFIWVVTRFRSDSEVKVGSVAIQSRLFTYYFPMVLFIMNKYFVYKTLMRNIQMKFVDQDVSLTLYFLLYYWKETCWSIQFSARTLLMTRKQVNLCFCSSCLSDDCSYRFPSSILSPTRVRATVQGN